MKNAPMLWLSVALHLAMFSVPVLAQTDSTAELAGLWGASHNYGPEVRGELTIIQDGSSWRASIAGFEVLARFEDGGLAFSLPGGRGEFRAHLTKDASKIVGHWIQPRTVTSGVRYATPVELAATKLKVWRGQVVPLGDSVSLYLSIQRQDDGSYNAFLRDPGHNIGIFRRLGRVQLQGDVVRIAGRHGEITGQYDKKAGAISGLPFYPPVEFTRRDREGAPGFYPRTPAVNKYVYHPPIAEDDGWTTASLTDVGIDPKPVATLIDRVLQTKTDSVTSPYLQGLLIARHGKLVLEEYFYGFHKDRPHDTRSASKSLTTTLIGIAIDHGARLGVTTPVYSLFPQYSNFAHADPRKNKMTVEHLLTMSSGFDCDDNSDSSPGNENTMQRQTGQPDWYKYTLDLPMARNPGEKALYCSAGINLLGGIVSSATKTWLPDFLYDHFARPLDIHTYHMNLTPTGDGYGGGGIYVRPRDFIKLGQLFLAGGRWNGRQVINRQWVQRATQPHASINSANDYGYGWWRKEYRVGDKTYRTFLAAGNGGQFVIVVPDLDLVVMFTGGNYSDGQTSNKFRDELMPQFIIPAVVGQ